LIANIAIKYPELNRDKTKQIDDAAWDVGAVNVENIGDNPFNDPEAREFYACATRQLERFRR